MAALARCAGSPNLAESANSICFSILPRPVHASVSDDEEEEQVPSTVALVAKAVIPPYGQRVGWRPSAQEDFADGGAYPECHVAQYPLEMGRKKVRFGVALSMSPAHTS